MKYWPFSVVLSGLTTTMSTGLGSPAANVHVMTLLVFCTQNDEGDGPTMLIAPVRP